MRLRQHIATVVLATVCMGLWLLPPARPLADDGGETVRARVVSVDDSALTLTGLLEYGTQHLEVELLGGPAEGKRFRAENELRAQLDIDKKFSPGDIATVTWPSGGAKDGDTLTKIAKAHGTMVAELKKLNGFDDKRADRLKANEIIKVPVPNTNAVNESRDSELMVKGKLPPRQPPQQAK